MSGQVSTEIVVKSLSDLLRETFEKVDGIYLDRGTSLIETLAGISAEEASRPGLPGGTTIAGHVAHVRFYIRVLCDYINGIRHEKLDWSQSWLIKRVSEPEWDILRNQIEHDYQDLIAQLNGISDWNHADRVGGAMGIAVHTAYHLGAIRQIVRVVRGK